MSEQQISFDVEGNIPRWANPTEFSVGKKIAIISFHRLDKNKGETTARFVDKDGKTYRLTFIDLERENKIRTLEVYAVGFKKDLANCVRKEFGVDSIPEGQPVLLRSFKEKVTYQGGITRDVNRWELTKVDGPIVDIPKEIVSE